MPKLLNSHQKKDQIIRFNLVFFCLKLIRRYFQKSSINSYIKAIPGAKSKGAPDIIKYFTVVIFCAKRNHF